MSNKIIKDAKLNTSSDKKKKKSEPKRLQQTTGGSSFGFSARNILLTIGAIIVLVSCIYVGYDQLRAKPIISVEDANGKKENYTMKELGYYIYTGEAQGQSYADMYAQFYGEGYDYWNAEADDEGSTNADLLADSIIQQAEKDFIIYQQAKNDGYEATDEDKSTAQEQTDAAVEAMTSKQKLIKGLSEKEIYQVILMQTVADRYRTDKIASLGLDYDDITKDIKKSDYKQYDFQYYYVATTSTNEDGESVELSDEEKENLKKQMEELLTTAKSAEDFATIFGTDEEGNAVTTNDAGISYKADGQLIEKDGFDEKIDKAIKKLKVDEISNVLEGSDGYYIIKMTDTSSTESYDNAISEAKTSAETEAFNNEYTANIEPNFTVNVDYDVWDNVKVGRYSI